MGGRLDKILYLAKENPALLSASEVATLAAAYGRITDENAELRASLASCDNLKKSVADWRENTTPDYEMKNVIGNMQRLFEREAEGE